MTKKIGIVCFPTFGGSGVVATELGIELAKKGYEIHFISYKQPFRLADLQQNVYYHEVEVYAYPLFEYSPYEIALTSKMVEIVQQYQLEILHVHYAIPHASSAYLAKQILATKGIPIKIITTLHGTDITLVGRDASLQPVVTFAINASDAVTSVSESLRKDTYAYFEVEKSIQVIPNFIDPHKYEIIDYCHIKKLFCTPDEKLIVHISNFRPVKRTNDVIHTFYGIQKQIPSHLVLLGDGPDKLEAEHLVQQLGIASKVTFLGKVREVGQVLLAADLFLLPSQTESFGLSALEAMVCRTPVISSNTGGLSEVNKHGFRATSPK